MVQSQVPKSRMTTPDIRISVDEHHHQPVGADLVVPPTTTTEIQKNNKNRLLSPHHHSHHHQQHQSWHIPRPSLLRSDRTSASDKTGSDAGSWKHHPDSPSRGSTSSQGSTASTRSAASGTLLLTAANLANLAAIHPPTVTRPKELDTASVASSTHFTVVNGIGRPHHVSKKSWCARNQLTVLVCTMSFLFMVGLLIGVLYMDMRVRDKFD